MSGAEFDPDALRKALPDIQMASEMWAASPDGQAHTAAVRERLAALPDVIVELKGYFGPNPMCAEVEAYVAEHGQPMDPLVHIGYGPTFRINYDDDTITLLGEAPEYTAVTLGLLAQPGLDGLSFDAGLLVMGRPPCVRYRPLWIDHGLDVVVCERVGEESEQ